MTAPAIVHLFPGDRTPSPGDEALCGWVLPGPFRPKRPYDEKCPTCLYLEIDAERQETNR